MGLMHGTIPGGHFQGGAITTSSGANYGMLLKVMESRNLESPCIQYFHLLVVWSRAAYFISTNINLSVTFIHCWVLSYPKTEQLQPTLDIC